MERIISTSTERIAAGAGVLATLAAAALVWFFNPVRSGFFPPCMFLKLTGIACPGCGLTRGFHAAMHGDFLTALDYNALLPLYAVFLGYFFVSLTLIALRGRGLTARLLNPFFVSGFFVVAIVFAVLRNLPIHPFSVLYP